MPIIKAFEVIVRLIKLYYYIFSKKVQNPNFPNFPNRNPNRQKWHSRHTGIDPNFSNHFFSYHQLI